MLFYLSKLVYIFLKPVTWIVMAFMVHLFSKRKKWKRNSLVLGVFVSIVFSNPAIQNIVLSLHEGNSIAYSDLEKEYDYVILLGGFSNLERADDMPYSMNERGNRLISTLEIYRMGKAEKIIISGGSGDLWQKRKSEALVVKDFMIRMGIPESDIIVEPNSRNTYENAKFTKEILDRDSIQASCILVTSAFHMPRASRLFTKQGIDIKAFPSDFINRPLNRPNNIFIPSGKTLWMWEVLIKEWVGLITYRLMGKL